jgi:ABC-type branched-subunit amino acid transport system ATPase component
LPARENTKRPAAGRPIRAQRVLHEAAHSPNLVRSMASHENLGEDWAVLDQLQEGAEARGACERRDSSHPDSPRVSRENATPAMFSPARQFRLHDGNRPAAVHPRRRTRARPRVRQYFRCMSADEPVRSYLERLEVEGGFLAGLDLYLHPGLNVIVGPRGAGKTSVIELIRFCLAVPAFTEEANQRAEEHALAVLGAGSIAATYRRNGSELLIGRDAGESMPRISPSGHGVVPLIVSQKEIESVGLDARGRLEIIDRLRGRDVTDSNQVERRLRLDAAAYTRDLHRLSEEIDQLRDRLLSFAQLDEQLAAAEQRQTEIGASASEVQSLQQSLDRVEERAAPLRRLLAEAAQASDALLEWREVLDRAAKQAPVVRSSASGGDPRIDRVAEAATAASSALRQAMRHLKEGIGHAKQVHSVTQDEQLAVERHARELRSQLEDVETGAGQAAREVTQLRARIDERTELTQRIADLRQTVVALQAERVEKLDKLDAIHDGKYAERSAIAADLSGEFGPEIDVRVSRAGLYEEYAAAITASLQGSGLRYGTLAAVLAERMSPRELAEAVERDDVEAVANLGGIAHERATRLVSFMQSQSTEKIVLAHVDDSVDMALLDGQEYKTTRAMSTGQRCTVMLPLLLSRPSDFIALDQPEDHLDNAFIVETLVHAIRNRRHDTQLIVATHNPNIPVLGEADRVIVMGSDGRRGFVQYKGTLDDPGIVDSITSLMEGGREAFSRRAEFYRTHPVTS